MTNFTYFTFNVAYPKSFFQDPNDYCRRGVEKKLKKDTKSLVGYTTVQLH